MLPILQEFRLDGSPIYCARYGAGHVNETYLVVDDTGRQYILQKLSGQAFHDPVGLMRNVAAITGHLRKKGAGYREALTLVETRDNGLWKLDGEGACWRMYDFVSDSVCLQRAGSPEEFKRSGQAFGRFQEQLSDFPAATLIETIPRFHDTPSRYDALKGAAAADELERAKECRPELEFALEREGYAGLLTGLLEQGELPLRVTHNDTKLNNVLFDRITRRPLCIIDLDTCMPGLSVNDFGDSIRFGASTGAEDEQELSRVSMSLELFAGYAQGFLSACGRSLTPAELAHLRDGAKMMTLECGVRFLTDFLMGDVYFRTSRPGHNLDRCRTQFKLVADMEKKWEQMDEIIRREADL